MIRLSKGVPFTSEALPFPSQALRASYAEARRLTRRYARTFYFASHGLDAGRRWASYAVYAFCRAADQVADEPGPDPQGELLRLRALLTQPEAHLALYPWALAWWDTVQRYGIPLQLFEELLRGVEMDFTQTRYETFEELRLYCYRVASVVGLMMVYILGFEDEKAFYYAERLGLAMQLTNIVRDVGEDWERGRVYLPQEELRRFGCDEADLAQKTYTPAYRALMAFQVERARAFYRQGLEGLKYLPSLPARLTVRSMASLYAGILDRLEAEGFPNLHKRVYVPLWRKVFLAAQQGALELREVAQRVSMRYARWGLVGLLGLTASALVSLYTGLFAEWRWMDSLYLFVWEAVVLGLALQARGSLRSFLVGALAGGAAEVIGVHTGWPFGLYHYTAVLQPQWAGVPVVIPLAWGALILYAAGMGPGKARLGRAGWAALLVTGIDVLLEPFATAGRGYWVWANGVIPWSNYLSWAFLSGGIVALLPYPLRFSPAVARGLSAAVGCLVLLVGSFAWRQGPLESAAAGSLLVGLSLLWGFLASWRGRLNSSFWPWRFRWPS